MPDFIFEKKVFYNPIEFGLHFIGGVWKMPILWRLNQTTLRYSEIKKTLPHISHKMLSSQLKNLENNEFIKRKESGQQVSYSITAKGKLTIPVIKSISNFGYQKGVSVKHEK